MLQWNGAEIVVVICCDLGLPGPAIAYPVTCLPPAAIQCHTTATPGDTMLAGWRLQHDVASQSYQAMPGYACQHRSAGFAYMPLHAVTVTCTFVQHARSTQWPHLATHMMSMPPTLAHCTSELGCKLL